MIDLKNVSMSYANGVEALKNVCLKVDKGEFVFLVGSSGSGKSSLLKLLIHEETADKGTIKINNFTVSDMKRSKIPFLRRKIGIVFQDFRLLPQKTIYENVAYAMQIVEASPKEIRRQVPFVLGLVGLSKKSDHFPNQVSGGEQQRAAIARAIVNNPSVILADEPTGNLDPENSWEIMRLLSDINHRGTTIVVATHDKTIVDLMRKRVIEIEKGKIIRDQEKGVYCCEA